MNEDIYDSDYLAHYGRKGMHWGQHLPDVLAKMSKAGQRVGLKLERIKQAKVDKENKKKEAAKQAQNDRDADLKEKTKSLKIENDYLQAKKTNDDYKVGRSFINKLVSQITNDVATNLGKKIASSLFPGIDTNNGGNNGNGKKGKNKSNGSSDFSSLFTNDPALNAIWYQTELTKARAAQTEAKIRERKANTGYRTVRRESINPTLSSLKNGAASAGKATLKGAKIVARMIAFPIR